MKKRDSKHIFALFYPDLSASSIEKGLMIRCVEKEIVHRISGILRLDSGDRLILFDGKMSAEVSLESFSKKAIEMKVITKGAIESPAPSLVLGCGLLKKEAFESVCYYAAQMGVQEVVPIVSEKVHRKWGGEKEQERLHAIMIAACEQSKQFAIPTIQEPQTLQAWLKEKETLEVPSLFLYLDAQGKPLTSTLNSLKNKKIPSVAMLVGPEGDFTPEEKELILTHEFSAVGLTESILRSQEAALVSLGIIRTFFRK